MNIKQLLANLDACTEPVPIETLKDWLQTLQIDADDIEQHRKFSEVGYQRNLIGRNSSYEALLLCFEAGQRTPVHDHAGSACGVKVIEGEGLETVFEPTIDGWMYATKSQKLTEGAVTGSVDMDVHQLSNLQPGNQRLVTLHIYSPPLNEVGNYSITDNTVTLVKAPTATALVE